ncbi:hypothetical protein AwDysgo_08980 [Bacteroidales bacterium]|nr:hypothetical protein AwDysgo_08980 [Bacteroidales bacterium]
MYAQIYPRIGINRSKKKENECKIFISKNERQKNGKTKRIGSMTRNKTVATTSISKNSFYDILEIGMMRGPKSMKIGLANMR